MAITIGPMLMSLYLSFTDYNLCSRRNGWAWTTSPACSSDARLHNSLGVTFTYVFVGVPLQLAVALLIALVLDKGLRGLPFYRSVFYLPSLLGGSVAVAILWKQIFGTTGLVNQVLAMFGIQGPGWISDPEHGAWLHHPAARLDVRRPDDHLPGRPAADPGHVLRGRQG